MVSLRLFAALLYRLCYARRDNEDGFDPDFFHQPRHMFGGIPGWRLMQLPPFESYVKVALLMHSMRGKDVGAYLVYV